MTTTHSPEVQELLSRGVDLQEALAFVAVVDAIELQVRRLTFNVHRVRQLIATATRVRSTSVMAAEDVLRSAVVLLHASLEDYMRAVAVAYLKFAPSSALNDIPFAGQGRDRPEKVLLGSLADHRDKSVIELIDLSIREHLDRKTFNRVDDIASLLQNLSCDLTDLRPFFSDIEQVMTRRHIIVHRADLAAEQNPRETPALGTIDESDVSRWARSIEDFALLTTKRVAMSRIDTISNGRFK